MRFFFPTCFFLLFPHVFGISSHSQVRLKALPADRHAQKFGHDNNVHTTNLRFAIEKGEENEIYKKIDRTRKLFQTQKVDTAILKNWKKEISNKIGNRSRQWYEAQNASEESTSNTTEQQWNKSLSDGEVEAVQKHLQRKARTFIRAKDIEKKVPQFKASRGSRKRPPSGNRRRPPSRPTPGSSPSRPASQGPSRPDPQRKSRPNSQRPSRPNSRLPSRRPGHPSKTRFSGSATKTRPRPPTVPAKTQYEKSQDTTPTNRYKKWTIGAAKRGRKVLLDAASNSLSDVISDAILGKRWHFPDVYNNLVNQTGPSDTLNGPSDTLNGPSDTLNGPLDTLNSTDHADSHQVQEDLDNLGRNVLGEFKKVVASSRTRQEKKQSLVDVTERALWDTEGPEVPRQVEAESPRRIFWALHKVTDVDTRTDEQEYRMDETENYRAKRSIEDTTSAIGLNEWALREVIWEVAKRKRSVTRKPVFHFDSVIQWLTEATTATPKEKEAVLHQQEKEGFNRLLWAIERSSREAAMMVDGRKEAAREIVSTVTKIMTGPSTVPVKEAALYQVLFKIEAIAEDAKTTYEKKEEALHQLLSTIEGIARDGRRTREEKTEALRGILSAAVKYAQMFAVTNHENLEIAHRTLLTLKRIGAESNNMSLRRALSVIHSIAGSATSTIGGKKMALNIREVLSVVEESFVVEERYQEKEAVIVELLSTLDRIAVDMKITVEAKETVIDEVLRTINTTARHLTLVGNTGDTISRQLISTVNTIAKHPTTSIDEKTTLLRQLFWKVMDMNIFEQTTQISEYDKKLYGNVTNGKEKVWKLEIGCELVWAIEEIVRNASANGTQETDMRKKLSIVQASATEVLTRKDRQDTVLKALLYAEQIFDSDTEETEEDKNKNFSDAVSLAWRGAKTSITREEKDRFLRQILLTLLRVFKNHRNKVEVILQNIDFIFLHAVSPQNRDSIVRDLLTIARNVFQIVKASPERSIAVKAVLDTVGSVAGESTTHQERGAFVRKGLVILEHMGTSSKMTTAKDDAIFKIFNKIIDIIEHKSATVEERIELLFEVLWTIQKNSFNYSEASKGKEIIRDVLLRIRNIATSMLREGITANTVFNEGVLIIDAIFENATSPWTRKEKERVTLEVLGQMEGILNGTTTITSGEKEAMMPQVFSPMKWSDENEIALRQQLSAIQRIIENPPMTREELQTAIDDAFATNVEIAPNRNARFQIEEVIFETLRKREAGDSVTESLQEIEDIIKEPTPIQKKEKIVRDVMLSFKQASNDEILPIDLQAVNDLATTRKKREIFFDLFWAIGMVFEGSTTTLEEKTEVLSEALWVLEWMGNEDSTTEEERDYLVFQLVVQVYKVSWSKTATNEISDSAIGQIIDTIEALLKNRNKSLECFNAAWLVEEINAIDGNLEATVDKKTMIIDLLNLIGGIAKSYCYSQKFATVLERTTYELESNDTLNHEVTEAIIEELESIVDEARNDLADIDI